MSATVNPRSHIHPDPSGRTASPAARPVRRPAAWQRLVDRSLHLLTRAQHESGALPAAVSFAPYGFCWFRDGAFIADGLSAAGAHDAATGFHAWCAAVMRREAPAVERAVAAAREGTTLPDDAYLPARYSLDGTRHVDDWWNFQVDGYGTWLWALRRHLERTGGDAREYRDAIDTTVRYLVAVGGQTCRDWWEEYRDERHVSTLAGVHAGLLAAAEMGTLEADLARRARDEAEAARAQVLARGVRAGHLVKWLDTSEEVDASLVSVGALYEMLPLDGEVMTATVDAVEAELAHRGPSGVHRYPSDSFYGGGQWPVLACLLAWHHAGAGDLTRAEELLGWVVDTADDRLDLPEQVGPLLAPEVLDEWLERWGPSARPLLWSHGMFLAALEALERARTAEASAGTGDAASAAPDPGEPRV